MSCFARFRTASIIPFCHSSTGFRVISHLQLLLDGGNRIIPAPSDSANFHCSPLSHSEALLSLAFFTLFAAPLIRLFYRKFLRRGR